MKGLVDRAHEQIIKLLTSEWLVSDVEDTSGMKQPHFSAK
jgi:hypothetical protein